MEKTMGQLQLRAEVHGERLLQARELFFDQGDYPDGLVDPLILRSWERCRRFGVGEIASVVEGSGGELNAYTSFDQTVSMSSQKMK
jgi:predicted Zn-dependent peptidase